MYKISLLFGYQILNDKYNSGIKRDKYQNHMLYFVNYFYHIRLVFCSFHISKMIDGKVMKDTDGRWSQMFMFYVLQECIYLRCFSKMILIY